MGIPPRRYPQRAVASSLCAALEGFCRTESRTTVPTVFHVAPGPLLPWSFPRIATKLAPGIDADGHSVLTNQPVARPRGSPSHRHHTLANQMPSPCGAAELVRRRRDAAKPSTSGVFSRPVGELPKQPASRRVVPLLEALGGDVAAIRFTAPPSAFRRPRGFSSSSRLAVSCNPSKPLPQA